MKTVSFVAALCMGLFVTMGAFAADTFVDAAVTPSTAQPGSAIAPTTTLNRTTPYAATPPVRAANRTRAMEVVGVILGIAVVVGIAAWAMRRRRHDAHYPNDMGRTDHRTTTPGAPGAAGRSIN